jgi:hypothetical protein
MSGIKEEADPLLTWVVLGRVIGQATAWDRVDDNTMVLYNFTPGETLIGILPDCDLGVAFDSGLFERYDPDTGQTLETWDIIRTIMHLPRTEE